jgi:hypothetical protein
MVIARLEKRTRLGFRCSLSYMHVVPRVDTKPRDVHRLWLRVPNPELCIFLSCEEDVNRIGPFPASQPAIETPGSDDSNYYPRDCLLVGDAAYTGAYRTIIFVIGNYKSRRRCNPENRNPLTAITKGSRFYTSGVTLGRV